MRSFSLEEMNYERRAASKSLSLGKRSTFYGGGDESIMIIVGGMGKKNQEQIKLVKCNSRKGLLRESAQILRGGLDSTPTR